MVFQSYALFRHMTVAENITFGPRIQDMDIDEDERSASNVIASHTCCVSSSCRAVVYDSAGTKH